MTTDTALLQQALDAMKFAISVLTDDVNEGLNDQIKLESSGHLLAAYRAIEARLAQPEQEPFEIEWPEYYDMGMGCGLEDRNITDRYDAMRYGWDKAIEAVAERLPEKLYTHPQPERTPLSKSVIKRLWHQADKEPENFARAIEKVHGIE